MGGHQVDSPEAIQVRVRVRSGGEARLDAGIHSGEGGRYGRPAT